MNRYGTPLIFAVLTAVLIQYNTTHDNQQLMLPLIDMLFPKDASNIQALGRDSIEVAVGLTALATVWAVASHLRAIATRKKAPES
jgi:hypothetical protein